MSQQESHVSILVTFGLNNMCQYEWHVSTSHLESHVSILVTFGLNNMCQHEWHVSTSHLESHVSMLVDVLVVCSFPKTYRFKTLTKHRPVTACLRHDTCFSHISWSILIHTLSICVISKMIILSMVFLNLYKRW